MSTRLLKVSGEGALQHLLAIDKDALPAVFLAPVGKPAMVETIVYAIADETTLLQSGMLKNVLITALNEVSDLTVAVPFSDVQGADDQPWDIAQAYVEALVDCMHRPSRVEFVCNSLLQADVLTVVCRKLLTSTVTDSTATDTTPIVADQTADSGGGITSVPADTTWYTVRQVLKRRRKKGKWQYMVEWDEDGSHSWVDRNDLSDAAVQSFVAKQKHKRRTRRN